MKIKYLGTGAAEGWPAVFCQCEACKAARRLGGRNIRHRSCALIDESLLLDLPSDLYGQALSYGIDMSQIKNILITHNHEDHFYPHELTNMTPDFGHILDGVPFTLYGSITVLDNAAKTLAGYDFSGLLGFAEAKAFQKFDAGSFTVTPLPANHGAGVSFIYLITSGEKTMLYAHDTGWPTDSVSEFLRGKELDFVSMDGTCLDGTKYEGHMTLDENIALKRRLISLGCAGEGTVFVANHFSHNGRLLHGEIEARLQPQGIITAYDGLEIAF